MRMNESKKKLCIIYNYAQHYRASIFKLIDENYECTFIFGKSYLDVKKMDYRQLKGKVIEVPVYRCGSFSYRRGNIRQLWHKYDAYIVLGETRVVSTWIFCVLSRLFPSRKVYLWSHGWLGKGGNIERIINKFMFALPNGGTFLYGNYARDLMIREGYDARKLFTIHNSLAYEEQVKVRKSLCSKPIYQDHFNNTNYNLIFVGRLTKVKKLDMILSAMKLCTEKGCFYNLTFIGDGDERFALEELSISLGIDKYVWFYGPCYDEKELGELIYNADLCVSPGNVGLTAIHAMVFGCPVVTHNSFSNQMPEFEAIKEGETGTFFKYGDVADLSLTIDKWFRERGNSRDLIRQNCMSEVDNNWTPEFQLNVIKSVIDD